ANAVSTRPTCPTPANAEPRSASSGHRRRQASRKRSWPRAWLVIALARLPRKRSGGARPLMIRHLSRCIGSDTPHGDGHGNGNGGLARTGAGLSPVAGGAAHSREHLNDPYEEEATLSMAFGADQSSCLQKVDNRCTLGRAASGHLVKAPLVGAGAATGALRDAEDDADAGAIELVAQDSVPASRY